jgi:hypothetical protein
LNLINVDQVHGKVVNELSGIMCTSKLADPNRKSNLFRAAHLINSAIPVTRLVS